jgi:cytochrome c oxidase subunit IV
MTDVADPGTELVPAGTRGDDAGAIVPAAEHAPEAAHAHAHPEPRQYVLIAVVLVILTGIEVAVSYLEGSVNSNVLIAVLGLMAFTKFFLVAAWYMHMRMDNKLFRRLFLIGIVGASTVYGIVFLFFSSTVLKS